MRASVSRAMIAFAAACLGERDRDWALAMRAELEEAIDAGQPLRFAFGCLTSSIWRLPLHSEGRFTITAYALAIGLMIPMAALQIGCALFGLPYVSVSGDLGQLSGSANAQLAAAYQSAIPSLFLLMLLMGLGHLRLAWMLLERDWARVSALGTLTLAMISSLFVIMSALMLDRVQILHQGSVLLIELAVLIGLSKWHADLQRAAEPALGVE